MLIGDNRWAGLRSLNGLDFVNPPLNLTFDHYNSQRALVKRHMIVFFVPFTLIIVLINVLAVLVVQVQLSYRFSQQFFVPRRV